MGKKSYLSEQPVDFDPETGEPIYELIRKKADKDEPLHLTPPLIPKPEGIPPKDFVDPNNPDDTTFGVGPRDLERMMYEADKKNELKALTGDEDEEI